MSRIKLRAITKKQKLAILVCLVVIIAVGALLLNVISSSGKTVDTSQLKSIVKDDTCKEGLQAAEKTSPDPTQSDVSISLLSYQASCLDRLGRYGEAIGTLKQLKQYYLQKGDNAQAQDVDRQIEEAKASMSSPSSKASNSSVPTDGTPQDVKAVQALSQEGDQ